MADEQQVVLCHYCEIREATTSDHIIPRSRGGSDARWNRVPACLPCNQAKGGSEPTCTCWQCTDAKNAPRGKPRGYGGRKFRRREERRAARGAAGVDLIVPELPRRYPDEEAP